MKSKEVVVTVILKTCCDCIHRNHSGSFTIRGLRSICSHPESSNEDRTTKKEFITEYPEYERDINEISDEKWKHHWYNRIVPDNKIPYWCPLRHGAMY